MLICAYVQPRELEAYVQLGWVKIKKEIRVCGKDNKNGVKSTPRGGMTRASIKLI